MPPSRVSARSGKMLREDEVIPSYNRKVAMKMRGCVWLKRAAVMKLTSALAQHGSEQNGFLPQSSSCFFLAGGCNSNSPPRLRPSRRQRSGVTHGTGGISKAFYRRTQLCGRCKAVPHPVHSDHGRQRARWQVGNLERQLRIRNATRGKALHLVGQRRAGCSFPWRFTR